MANASSARDHVVTSLRIERETLSLRERAVAMLRLAIRRGDFTPGERLVERRLCELLGVSRTVVREALRQLEADGLVRNVGGQGPSVARFSLDEMVEIYDVRNALESRAVELFVERADAAEIDRLDAIVSAMGALSPDQGPEGYLALVGDFYAVLLKGARNALLQNMNQAIMERTLLMRTRTAQHALYLRDTVAEKRRIVDAIKDHDAERARLETVQHMAAALKRMLGALAPAASGAHPSPASDSPFIQTRKSQA